MRVGEMSRIYKKMLKKKKDSLCYPFGLDWIGLVLVLCLYADSAQVQKSKCRRWRFRPAAATATATK